jgi:formate dehydrogenase subunit gamma
MTTRPDLAAQTPARDAPEIARFDRTQRIVHWTTATCVLVLIVTGLCLYAGPLSTLVGRRHLLRTVHVVAGIATFVPFLAGIVGRHGAALRADVMRINRWTRDDAYWLRRRPSRLGKFNPGQKLNATFLAAALVVMLVTGVIMNWFSLFALDTRTGATFVHDWFALGVGLAVLGHVWLALHDRDALHGMTHGTVTEGWARRHRPRWWAELRSDHEQQNEPVETAAPS